MSILIEIIFTYTRAYEAECHKIVLSISLFSLDAFRAGLAHNISLSALERDQVA